MNPVYKKALPRRQSLLHSIMQLYQERFGDDNQQDEQNQNGTYRSETSVSVASSVST